MRTEGDGSGPSVEGEDDRPALPEGTEHVVVIDRTGAPARATAPEIRIPASRLQRYDDVDLEEYVDEDEDPEDVRVFFEPGDELPLPVAADGTHRSFSDRLACFDGDGNRLDSNSHETDEGVRQWRAGSS